MEPRYVEQQLREFGVRLGLAGNHDVRQFGPYQLMATGYPNHSFNYIFAFDEMNLDALKEAVQYFRDNDIQGMVCLGDGQTIPEPEALGLTYLETCLCMDFDYSKPIPDSPIVESFEMIEVKSGDQLTDWDAIAAECFGMPITYSKKLFEPVLDDEKIHLFLVGYQGKMQGQCALYVDEQGFAGSYWGSLLAEARSQSVSDLAIIKQMHMAKAWGCERMAVQCMGPSQSLFTRLGFEVTSKLPLYAV